MNAMLEEQIVIANQMGELRRMTEWLHDSLLAMEVAKDSVFKLDLCANEAVANIITYAYNDKGHHDIILEMRKTADGTSLVICDDGMPFNPLNTPEHQSPRGLPEARIGGLGIHLIRQMASRCNYQRVKGFNILSLEV